MTGISFYCFLWRLISVRRVRASNGRQNRFFYRSHRNGQSRKNIVFMRLCGVSGIHFLRHGEQIILLFFIIGTANANMNYFLFGIMCLTLCYALATIRKVSKGVFPCILTHCLINGLSAIFVFNYSLLSCCITLIVTIIVSILILNVNKRYIR